MTAIAPAPLHVQVRDVLRDRIVNGELEPGSRLVESRLAEQLGVSRTPLREALMHLEHEGWVELVPNRGFSVASLSSSEANELFPLVALLEGEALRLAGAPEDAALERLDELNVRIAAVHGVRQRAVADMAWHRQLTRDCSGGVLAELLEGVRRKVLRHLLLGSGGGDSDHDRNVEQHEEIAEALAEGDLEQAAACLRNHWRSESSSLLARDLQR